LDFGNWTLVIGMGIGSFLGNWTTFGFSNFHCSNLLGKTIVDWTIFDELENPNLGVQSPKAAWKLDIGKSMSPKR
jgi:hypothetical protein